jgi:hypothetical protein
VLVNSSGLLQANTAVHNIRKCKRKREGKIKDNLIRISRRKSVLPRNRTPIKNIINDITKTTTAVADCDATVEKITKRTSNRII